MNTNTNTMKILEKKNQVLGAIRLEAAPVHHRIFWYCSLKAGVWPDNLPIAAPEDWEDLSYDEKQAHELVIHVRKACTRGISCKVLAVNFHTGGYSGSPMNVDEFADWWERGGWSEWGTRMAG